VLDGLLVEGMSPVQIHYRLADDALALQRVHAAVARGYALPMALRDERIWGVREKLFARAVPLLNNAKVNALVVAAHQIDGITKGLEHANWPKDATLAMHQWVIMFAKACGASTLKNL
jgi:DNA polymerase-3 subunit delta